EPRRFGASSKPPCHHAPRRLASASTAPLPTWTSFARHATSRLRCAPASIRVLRVGRDRPDDRRMAQGRAAARARRRRISRNRGRDPEADNRVVRGGSFRNNARNCRSAYRNRRHPSDANDNVGFRVALPAREGMTPVRERCAAQWTGTSRAGPAPRRRCGADPRPPGSGSGHRSRESPRRPPF
ncbi:MAG: SUMF1/EgtB/PvdO family nonheme iron enzyme, partial [bacterium]|nr:SUMF1/EgtB/PvdO family nonheme iron enzyme [bacterium]